MAGTAENLLKLYWAYLTFWPVEDVLQWLTMPSTFSAAVLTYHADERTLAAAACLPGIPALLEALSMFVLNHSYSAVQTIDVTLP